jgi:hypothetical protein
MDRLRCGPLAAWAAAWLAGLVAFDDVLVALSRAVPVGAGAGPVAGSRSSVVSAVTADDSEPVQLGELLINWRQSGGAVRVILPVAGDVRGCPGPASFRQVALDAGEAVVGTGIATVPLVIDHRPSSAPPTLVWRRYAIEPAVADFVSVADAQFELSESIRECATAIAREVRNSAASANSSMAGFSAAMGEISDAAPTDVTTEIASARRAGERLNLPPGFPSRAVMLIAQAERMAAVLAITGTGGYPIQNEAGRERAQSLAPLVTAVRRARIAGYNALADA